MVSSVRGKDVTKTIIVDEEGRGMVTCSVSIVESFRLRKRETR